MNRLRGSAKLFSSVPRFKNNVRHKALRSWTAVQDTFYTTKDVFESHKVVFTVGTSIASVATACVGYTLRHLHDTRVDRRLESIEKTIKDKHHINEAEIKEVIGSGSVSLPSCIATAGTTLVIGYILGWRGGRWSATKQFRKEQMKLLGQIKPKRWELLRQRIQQSKGWQFQFLKRPLLKFKPADTAVKMCQKIKDVQQPKGWQFQFLKRPLLKLKTPDTAVKICEKIKDVQQPKGWQFQFLKRPLLLYKTPDTAVTMCKKIKDVQTGNNLQNYVNRVSKRIATWFT